MQQPDLPENWRLAPMRESRSEPSRPPIPPIWRVAIVSNRERNPSPETRKREITSQIQPPYQDDDELARGEGDVRGLGRHEDAHVVGQADHLAAVHPVQATSQAAHQ